jgi:hypothetical protein
MRNVTPYLRPSTLVAICADLQHSSEDGEDESEFQGEWDAAMEMLESHVGKEEAKALIGYNMKESF